MLARNEIEQRKLVQLETNQTPPSASYDQTSYNLRLGRQYCLVGTSATKQQVEDCSIGPGILRLPPFACALVSTEELVKLPNDVFGQWGLKIRPAMSGLIFQAGPQIEPGSHGRLFGLLFNLSSSERALHYLTPMWSIDFHEVANPVNTASPPPQPVLSIADYTQMGLPTGSLNEIYADYKALTKENSAKRELGIAIFLAVVVLLASTLLPIVVTRLADSSADTARLQERIQNLENQVTELQRQLAKLPSSTTTPR